MTTKKQLKEWKAETLAILKSPKGKSTCSCATGTWGKQTPPPVCKNYRSPKSADQEGVCVNCEHDELCHIAKTTNLTKPRTGKPMLLISVDGGNIAGVMSTTDMDVMVIDHDDLSDRDDDGRALLCLESFEKLKRTSRKKVVAAIEDAKRRYKKRMEAS